MLRAIADTLTTLLVIPLAIVVYVIGMQDGIDHQQHMSCPVGTYVDGVRPNGMSACVTAPPPGCDEPAGTAREQRPCVYDERRTAFRIYCTGGTRPIVIDARTIGCQR